MSDALKAETIKLVRPATGDVFNALRTDSAGIADLLNEGWEIAATVALTDQQIYDRFSFLEGLVGERTYEHIAETAIEIARTAAPHAPIEQWQFRVKGIGSPIWTNITHSDANELKDNPAFQLRALSLAHPQVPDGAEAGGVISDLFQIAGYSDTNDADRAKLNRAISFLQAAAPLTREAATVPLAKRIYDLCGTHIVKTGDDFQLGAHELAVKMRALIAAAESKTFPRESAPITDEALMSALKTAGFHIEYTAARAEHRVTGWLANARTLLAAARTGVSDA